MAGMSERQQLQMAMEASRLEDKERRRRAAADNPQLTPTPGGVSTTDEQAPPLDQAPPFDVSKTSHSARGEPLFFVGSLVYVNDERYVDAHDLRPLVYKIIMYLVRGPTTSPPRLHAVAAHRPCWHPFESAPPIPSP